LDSPLFRCKSIDQLLSDSENAEIKLKKSLGWLSLTSLGIGAVIGSGIFTIIGTAIAGQKMQVSSVLNAPLLQYLIYHSTSYGRPGAGPAIALSFVLVAIVCGFASVCYAELAAMIPIAGSAYTYTYATMGELIAWIIGWDLILEYAVSNMAVSVGFSATSWVSSTGSAGIPIPNGFRPRISPPACKTCRETRFTVPAGILDSTGRPSSSVMLLTIVLVRGIKESAETNNIMVFLKLVAIMVFVSFAARFHSPRQLASLRSQWLAGNPHRWLHRLLHLHRV